MAMRFISHPTVSAVLLPVDSSEEYLDLSVGEDYSIGKLIRSGLDGVHGLNGRVRVYDSGQVRDRLLTIANHRHRYTPPLLVHQGHGNIGLNNYAVCYKKVDPNKSILIVPAGEPLHERIYPCFIRTRLNGRRDYKIEELIFFIDRSEVAEEEIVEWNEGQGVPQGAEMAEKPNPDRELEGDCVYIPIWDGSLADKPLKFQDQELAIDWGALGGSTIQFARIKRTEQGTLDNLKLRLVRVTEGNLGPWIDKPVDDVEFAFFGIPVESLIDTTKSLGYELARHAHYFYDLRHLIDLIGVGNPKFYLLEHALKRDGYRQARQLLEGYREGCDIHTPIEVDICELHRLVVGYQAHPNVKQTLEGFCNDRDNLKKSLTDEGYHYHDATPAQPKAGNFTLEKTSGGKPVLKVWPRRNTYSFSFIGLITGPGDPKSGYNKQQRYLLLAVTGGQGGLRHHGGHFDAVMATGLNLEVAVGAVYQKLAQLWGPQNDNRVGPDHDDRLLLLDQGGDVHQWIGVGDLGYVIGSNAHRGRMSSLLTVLKA